MSFFRGLLLVALPLSILVYLLAITLIAYAL